MDAVAKILKQPARQIAYHVPDARKAALAHSKLFGSGPYFVADNIPLTKSLYRGKESYMDHTSAYGQWGEVMIEMVQINNDNPSVFRDLYHRGQSGMHHVALIVDNLQQAMAQFEAAGFPTGFYGEVGGPHAAFAMMDAITTYGHFIELYEPSEGLLWVYDLVKSSSLDWDGSEVIRSFSLG